MDFDALANRLFPSVTNEEQPCGDILCYAQSDITCYVLRGKHGDLLIDTGMPQIWNGLHKWLSRYDIRYILLTHAHADHDWNAARLQKAGVKILLSEYDRDLRQNYLSHAAWMRTAHHA